VPLSVVSVSVKVGDRLDARDKVATIDAMKMEASVTAPIGRTVERIALTGVTQVDGGDLLRSIR